MNEPTNVESQLDDIRGKLDLILEEAAVMRRRRQEMEELKSDLTLIGKDAYDHAVAELEDIAPFVQTGDFIYLVKKLLRNVSTITGILSKVESSVELMGDAGPISRELFQDGLNKLDELDRKGYFEFARGLTYIFDMLAAQLPPEESKKLADNVIGPTLELLKLAGETNLLPTLHQAAQSMLEAQEHNPKQFDLSLWSMLRGLNSKEARRSIGYLLFFVKQINGPHSTSQDERHQTRRKDHAE